jgi:hypothetical protein
MVSRCPSVHPKAVLHLWQARKCPTDLWIGSQTTQRTHSLQQLPKALLTHSTTKGCHPHPDARKWHPQELFERSSTEHTQEHMMWKLQMLRKGTTITSGNTSEQSSVRLAFHTDTVSGGNDATPDHGNAPSVVEHLVDWLGSICCDGNLCRKMPVKECEAV